MSKIYYYGWTKRNDLIVSSNLESVAPVCSTFTTVRAASISQARRIASTRVPEKKKTAAREQP